MEIVSIEKRTFEAMVAKGSTASLAAWRLSANGMEKRE